MCGAAHGNQFSTLRACGPQEMKETTTFLTRLIICLTAVPSRSQVTRLSDVRVTLLDRPLKEMLVSTVLTSVG